MYTSRRNVHFDIEDTISYGNILNLHHTALKGTEQHHIIGVKIKSSTYMVRRRSLSDQASHVLSLSIDQVR